MAAAASGKAARLGPEEREALRRQMAREQETSEQKWLRSAIREEVAEWAESYFAVPEEEGEPPKASGPSGFDFGGLFGAPKR